MKLIRKLLFVGTVLGAVNTAMAANNDMEFGVTNYYAGGSLGLANVDFSEMSPGYPQYAIKLGAEGDNTAIKIFGGLQIGRFKMVDLAVEAGYTDFGSASGNAIFTSNEFNIPSGTTFGKVKVDASAFSLAGLASLPLGVVDVFGKLGIAKGNLDVDVDYPEYNIAGEVLTRSKWDVYYAFGVKKQIGPIEVRGEYEIFNMYASSKASYLSIGGSYKF